MKPITETELRKAIHERLTKKFARSPTLLVDELGFNGHVARVDVAVINCALHAYELKSDRDNLDRLPNQLAHYADQFHYTTVVTTDAHIDGAREIADESTGFIHAARNRSGRIVLRQVTRAKKRKLSVSCLTRLFWHEEATEAMRRHNLMRGNSRLKAEERRTLLAKHLTTPELLTELRLALAERRETQRREKQRQDDGSTLWHAGPSIRRVRPLQNYV